MPRYERFVSCVTAAALVAIGFWPSNATGATGATGAANGRLAAIRQTRPVTFNRDVAPILHANCVGCHRQDGIGPFGLTTYADARPQAARIAAVTAERQMPPWKPVPGHGRFRNERRLSDAEIALLSRWAATGAAEGDPADLPPAPGPAGGWQLGAPDLVVAMPDPFLLPSGGADVYRNFVLPVELDARRWVRAVELRPGAGGGRVIHHARILLDGTGAARALDAAEAAPGYDGLMLDHARFPAGHFLGWAPGKTPAALPDAIAWPLDPGTDLVLQLHLLPGPEPVDVQPAVGIHFADRPASLTPVSVLLTSKAIRIPAGAPAHVIEDRYRLPVAVDVLGIAPHMHYLGKRVEAWATLPDGSEEPLLRIDDWDFNWQDVYRYETRPFLPAGTTVAMEYVYDNSAANPRNPDHPPRRVRFGQFSNDEMGDLWLQLLPRSEADRRMLARTFMPKVLNEDIVGYESMLAADPDNAVLHRDVAVLYMTAGRTAAAIRHYRRSIELDSASATAHYNLATLLAAGGTLDEAVRHFRRAVALRPGHAAAHNNLGAVLRALGRLAEATPYFERAVALDASNAAAHNNLASALASTGRAADAVRHYRRALVLEPDGIESLTSLAWILATTGDPRLRAPEEAAALAERAAALTNRRDVNVLATLAAACAAAGRFDDALEAQRQAIALARPIGGPELMRELQRRLSLYLQRQPLRPAR
jgi:tetratricopeptide (TPR) repeat protein/mono/diheme cytochrome c family protein